MARFTKKIRQEIVRDFCLRNNGRYDASKFVKEIEDRGPEHPAYGWFEWDDDKAAYEYRVWQAREFANDLKVTFSVEEIRGGKITVRETEAPLVVSPMDQRRTGGGYSLFDPDDPEIMAEYCREAASRLSSWLDRYRGALEHCGGSVKSLERQIKMLEASSHVSEKAA